MNIGKAPKSFRPEAFRSCIPDHMEFAAVDEILNQSRLMESLQHVCNPEPQSFRRQHHGITREAGAGMFESWFHDSGKLGPPILMRHIENPPQRRWNT
jgi:hypothetical protein